MLKEYHELFRLYLRICKNDELDVSSTKEDYNRCCSRCDRFREQLFGMLDLLYTCGVITDSEREKEAKCIVEEFSIMVLYHAYIEKEAVYMNIIREYEA